METPDNPQGDWLMMKLITEHFENLGHLVDVEEVVLDDVHYGYDLCISPKGVEDQTPNKMDTIIHITPGGYMVFIFGGADAVNGRPKLEMSDPDLLLKVEKVVYR